MWFGVVWVFKVVFSFLSHSPHPPTAGIFLTLGIHWKYMRLGIIAECLLDRFPSGFLNVSGLKTSSSYYPVSGKTILMRTDGEVAQVFPCLEHYICFEVIFLLPVHYWESYCLQPYGATVVCLLRHRYRQWAT